MAPLPTAFMCGTTALETRNVVLTLPMYAPTKSSPLISSSDARLYWGMSGLRL